MVRVNVATQGVTPAYFRWAARKQISHYKTVTMTNGTVTKIVPGDEQNSYFVITATSSAPEQGQSQTITARKVVLATGLRDILPDTPGLRENWGQGIFWCPWCDGHEHADQPLGLLGSLADVPGAVREMVTLNSDVVAFVNGTDTPSVRAVTEGRSPGWEAYLDAHNVTVDNRTIAAITRLQSGGGGDGEPADPSLPTAPEHDLFRVDFAEGPPVERAAFLASFPAEQASRVGEDMGVHLYGGRLAADPAAGLVTNIPGVYAVGDCNSDNVTNVPHAMFSGKRAAVYVHGESSTVSVSLCFSIRSSNNGDPVRLAREDGEKELAEEGVEKRDMELEARSLWDTVNGRPGDILYAGEFDGH